MLLQHNVFYRKFGIRLVQHLITPRMFKMEDFRFPLNSTFHFVSHDENSIAPDQAQPHFAAFKSKRIGMEVIPNLTSMEGNPRKTSLQVIQLARKFFQKNRLFRFTKDVNSVVRDPNAVTVLDYGYLLKMYRYANAPLTPYFEWLNIEKTAWNGIKDTVEKSERHNFIFYEVPDVLPSINTLKQFSKKISTNYRHFFDTPGKKFLLELWKWIGEDTRKDSILSAIPIDQLGKVNIVFTFKGMWCVLNLQQLEDWRRVDTENEAETEDKSHSKPHTVKYLPSQLQRLLIKLCIGVQTYIVPPDEEDNKDNAANEKSIQLNNTENQDSDSGMNEDEKDEDVVLGNRREIEDESTEKHQDLETLEKDLDSESTTADIMDEIDKELETLETIEKRYMMAKSLHQDINADVEGSEEIFKQENFIATPEEIQSIQDKIFTEREADEVLKNTIDKHSEFGLMSAAEYRNLLKQADKFMNSPDPHLGTTTIKEFVKVNPEVLKIEHHETKLAERETVADKSMLSSSLIAFDKKYINEVMDKDISAMAVNIQKAGIILQSYEVEPFNSVLGAFEVHTLKVKPIDGAPSTIRFKIPKVDEEGNFVANGNKYHMRKQRGD